VVRDLELIYIEAVGILKRDCTWIKPARGPKINILIFREGRLLVIDIYISAGIFQKMIEILG
jgi:hypothetical protein